MKNVTQEQLTSVEPYQLSQINMGTFDIKGIINPLDVLAPLVSAEMQTTPNGKTLNIKIAVFIPTPMLGKPPLELFWDPQSPAHELTLYLKFNSSETPAEYHAWYVCYNHVIDPGEQDIHTLNTILQNTYLPIQHPRTKRGTVTHVLES